MKPAYARQMMGSRHTAALAFVVWYIIAPPFDRGGPKDVPLSSWQKRGHYASRAECDRALLAAQPYLSQRLLDDPRLKPFAPAIASELLATECVASDEPRLGAD